MLPSCKPRSYCSEQIASHSCTRYGTARKICPTQQHDTARLVYLSGQSDQLGVVSRIVLDIDGTCAMIRDPISPNYISVSFCFRVRDSLQFEEIRRHPGQDTQRQYVELRYHCGSYRRSMDASGINLFCDKSDLEKHGTSAGLAGHPQHARSLRSIYIERIGDIWRKHVVRPRCAHAKLASEQLILAVIGRSRSASPTPVEQRHEARHARPG